MPKVHPLLAELRRKMHAQRDPDRAAAHQAYMKSSMPSYGLRNSEMRAIAKETFASYTIDSNDDGVRWRADVLGIWRGAERREERYAAIELAQLRKARPL